VAQAQELPCNNRDEEQLVRLPDDREARLRCYKTALRNEAIKLAGPSDYVKFKKRPQEWLRNELAEYTLREICRVLHAYVEGGGVPDEQVEKRPEYVHFMFHYDLRVPIGGRRIYFETVLEFEDAEDEDDLTIVVVNIHDV
jgi:hypothetical protein